MNITKQKQPHRCGVTTSRGVGADRRREGGESQTAVYVTDRLCCAVLSSSAVSDSATPRTAARQAPLSMGFFRREY